MGSISDKPLPPAPIVNTQPEQETVTTNTPSLQIPQITLQIPLCDSNAIVSAKILEAIKKQDLILFQRAIQQYEIKPSEFIGSSDQAKTILHKLAEYNFSEGMAFLLDELTVQKSTQLSKVLNMKDADGNTPLLLCCLSNAVETLEVLARNEFVDIEAKNFAKKTALEIALEMESPCINVLTSIASSEVATKATLKSSFSRDGSQYIEDNKGSQNECDTRTSLDGSKGPVQTSQARNSDPLRFIETRLAEILKELALSNINFIDSEFPHEMWYLATEENEQALHEKFPELAWNRASEFMDARVRSPVLFGEFLPNMTAKTPLAGCEIYSALAVLAEYPQRLSNIFNTKEVNSLMVNKQGVYSLNFTVAGVRIEILLDDYFPSRDGSQLLYSHPLDNELWFSLLEKAFAKLHGGYHGLEHVGILEALETLTGMPVAQKSLKDADQDKIWVKLIDYDKKNYVMCAGETKRYHTAFRNRIFTVVNVYDCFGYRLVKLRNHFDTLCWEGDFSANSPLWTKELREEVGYHEMDTSCFFMTLKDFTREFDFLTVCHYHENWTRHTVNTYSEPNHASYFELTIDRETEAYISVHQKHPRFMDEEEDCDYEISPIEMILAKDLDGKIMESIAVGERDAFVGKPTTYIHDSHRVKLEAGKYIFYVKARWVDNQKHDFMVNVLSSVPTKFSQIESHQCPDFLSRLYLGAGQLSKDQFNMATDCQFASGWSGSHLWMYAVNNTSKVWHLEVTFEKLVNLKLGKKHRAMPDVIKFVIQPYQKAAAYAKRTSPGAVAVAWNFAQRLE